jgi:hypothetical protein
MWTFRNYAGFASFGFVIAVVPASHWPFRFSRISLESSGRTSTKFQKLGVASPEPLPITTTEIGDDVGFSAYARRSPETTQSRHPVVSTERSNFKYTNRRLWSWKSDHAPTPILPPVAALALIADAVIVTVVPAGPLFFTTMALSW